MKRLHPVCGFTLLEVLITIIILAFGLLGLAGMQSNASIAERESYQRTQALILLQDMVDRINLNSTAIRAGVAAATVDTSTSTNYLTGGTDAGTAGTVPDCTALSGAALDLCEWDHELRGMTESRAGSNVGTLASGRGCILRPDATDSYRYLVVVAWQGMIETTAPAVACGSGAYGAGNLDKARRAVSAVVQVTALTN
jgi:type IV pilus assembly protein PilV